jgi:hypothetical protein
MMINQLRRDKKQINIYRLTIQSLYVIAYAELVLGSSFLLISTVVQKDNFIAQEHLLPKLHLEFTLKYEAPNGSAITFFHLPHRKVNRQ